MRRRRPRSTNRVVASLAVAAGALALASGGWWASNAHRCDVDTIAAVGVTTEVPARANHAAQDVLAGVWWRYEQGTTGDPVRFYYFHGDGTGLYRYGHVGHTYTHSLDYTVDGATLQVRFRKTGVEHDVGFSLEVAADGGRDWLTLQGDPREPATTRYFRLPEPRGPRTDGAAAALHDPGELGPPPAGHMWIDLQRFATGGQGFYFYQLRPAGIDGRGVGWFHRGDFDDWSTESLAYRVIDNPPRLELTFELAGTTQTSAFELAGQGAQRSLRLEADPRDFGQSRVYRDAGRSFGAAGGLAERDRDPRLSAVLLLP